MIEINDLTGKIDKRRMLEVAEMVFKGDLSIVFVDSERIRDLNKKYRGKDEPTDVLSFGENLKEIVICPEIVEKNAKKLKLDYNKELAKVLIHGILHILGFDHEKEEEAKIMEEKEKYYLSLLS